MSPGEPTLHPLPHGNSGERYDRQRGGPSHRGKHFRHPNGGTTRPQGEGSSPENDPLARCPSREQAVGPYRQIGFVGGGHRQSPREEVSSAVRSGARRERAARSWFSTVFGEHAKMPAT